MKKLEESHYLILCSYSNQDTVNFGGRIETYINGTEQSLQVDPQNNSQNIKYKRSSVEKYFFRQMVLVVYLTHTHTK